MKKFGTPIGAGPGSANENVGFDGVGAPLLLVVWLLDGLGAGLGLDWGFGVGFGAGLGLGFGFGLLGGAGEALWCEGGCTVPVLVVLGGGCCEVEVDVVGVEVVVDVVGAELVSVVDVDVVGVEVVGVEVEVEVVPDDGVHKTLRILVPFGGWTSAADRALIVNVFSFPVASTLTMTVHTSADAAGICATSMSTDTTPVVTATARSLALQGAAATHLGFWLLSKFGLSSHRVPCAALPRRGHVAARPGRY